jgi:hypothetical protein
MAERASAGLDSTASESPPSAFNKYEWTTHRNPASPISPAIFTHEPERDSRLSTPL